MVGLSVGLPASLLVINRRLYKIASRTEAITMKADRRRAVYVDLAIGLSIPFVQMLLRESTPDRFASPASDCRSFFQSSLLRDIASTSSRNSDAFQTTMMSLWHTPYHSFGRLLCMPSLWSTLVRWNFLTSFLARCLIIL